MKRFFTKLWLALIPKQIKGQILDLHEKAKFSEEEIEKRSFEKAKMISEEEIRKVKKQLNLEIMENDLLKRSLQDLQDLRKENAELKKKLSISEAYQEIFLDKLQSCNLQQLKKEIKKEIQFGSKKDQKSSFEDDFITDLLSKNESEEIDSGEKKVESLSDLKRFVEEIKLEKEKKISLRSEKNDLDEIKRVLDVSV
jgi:hypothetical protein